MGAAPQKPVKGRRETIDYADKDFQLYCKEAGGGGDLPGFYGDRRGSYAPGLRFGTSGGTSLHYNHHEQACAMAAEAYARIHNRIAALCVTTGPGGTNAITGVVGGWLDSIPMLVLSGQVRYDTTARWSGVGIRAMGDQEFDICKAISCMTKYSEMVLDPLRIRYCLEKALYLAKTGRPGPCWLDIPLNVQGAYVEEEDLVGFDPEDYEAGGDGWTGGDHTHRIPEDEAGKGEITDQEGPCCGFVHCPGDH